MSLKDVAGVFSRYFIVGFFLPTFFVVMGLARSPVIYWMRALSVENLEA